MARVLGPNLKRLIIEKMSTDAIPAGGGLGAGLQFLMTPGAIGKGWKEAAAWVDQAIGIIRQAAEPNPWKYSSEEEIAGHILEQIKQRRAAPDPGERTQGK